MLFFYHVKSKGTVDEPPIQVKVKLDNFLVTMDVDTGAAMSLMFESVYRGLWPNKRLDD